jgi:hypothetical protein
MAFVLGACIQSSSVDEPQLSGCPLDFKNLLSMFTDDDVTTVERDPNSPVYDGFSLPISYVNKKEQFEVSSIVSSDLELLPVVDLSGSNLSENTQKSMYEYLCRPTNTFSKQLIRDMHHIYTTNTEYLQDTQNVLGDMGKYNEILSKINPDNFIPDCEMFMRIWKHTKENSHFLEQYSYMEWSFLKYLNHSTEFLQTLSIINILSPLFSLLIPILFLAFPFLLLRLRGIEITFEQYVDTLKDISKNHFIGKALNLQFTLEGILYFGMTAGLYLLQTYQNVMSCYRYYMNISKMNEHLVYMKEYTQLSIHRMETFAFLHSGKHSYQGFCADIQRHIIELQKTLSTLENITPFSHTFHKMANIGHMLSCYYQLHENDTYEKSIRYSIGFNAYMDNLNGIYENIQAGYLGKAHFAEDTEPVFENQYYPSHLQIPNYTTKCVKNNCDLSQNIIITGVNASGKTTFLKTTAINILVSQQFGVGFYSACAIRPFTHIHSYLNIPDTSGRDSLFQAESRRCKEIIDIIESTKNDNKSRHFVIFDELYSGTNPVEATKSATSLLKYLSKFENVRFILTTHYVSVCKKFKKSPVVCNYKMNVKVSDSGKITYLYTIKKGISKIQGGVEILKMMNYPEEILNDIRCSK